MAAPVIPIIHSLENFRKQLNAALASLWASAGTVTHTAGSLTSGQLIVGNGPADITVGDLSGDVSTSGSCVTTIGALKVATGMIQASAVTEAKIGLSNVTTNDVSTSAHGFAPILPNDANKYLDGTGAYSVPPGTGGNWKNIGTASPSGTNTVTFSSLGSHRHLMIVGVGRSTQAGSGADNIALIFNGDTTAGHYATQLTYSDSSGIHSLNLTASQTNILPAQLGQASVLANSATIFTILVPFYSQSTFSKSTQGQYTYIAGASLPAFGQLNTAGYWSQTAAITSFTMTITGNFVAGSMIDVFAQD